MVLVQEGKLKLEDNISQYLEGSPDTWKPITQTLVDAQRQGSSAKAEMLRESQTDFFMIDQPHTTFSFVKDETGQRFMVRKVNGREAARVKKIK